MGMSRDGCLFLWELASLRQDLMVAVKTHGGNHATRLPLLRRLWASKEALLKQAQQHLGEDHHAHAHMVKEEQKQLEEVYGALLLRFFSDTADAKRGIEAPEIAGAPAGKAGLCLRLQHILREFLGTPETRRFLVVTDDDTLLNFRHAMDLLSLTLQPPIPARGFMANLLADQQGYRAYSPAYLKLAQDIRAYLRARAAAAAATGQTAEGMQKATPASDSRYSPEQLTGASSVYGWGGSRPLEALSPLYLGERYAYGITGANETQGYEYGTMGGSIALDREAVRLVVACIESGKCTCPPDGTADDMLLGMWLKQLRVPLVHARGLHQEKPADYHPLLVEAVTPVSFHRMQQSVNATKKLFADYVNISDHSASVGASSSGKALSAEELVEVDWIDYDWHHVEEHLWLEREELQELEEDYSLLHKGVGDIFSRKVTRGIRPMTPEELLEHDELEELSAFHDEL
ncbi:fringe-like family related protein [Cyclospora cayetanensis]|uniref:Fringe-like family related protein n=1 Tax=Cyclospora cayetanensis TaxID=88456 RepID=A0A1D3D9Y8_9EIME|nr:fringe-like family related protein [Cyclospora cayetanensis]